MKTKIWIRLLLALLLGAMLLSVVACGKDNEDPVDSGEDDTVDEEIEYPFVIEDCGSGGHAGRFNMATRTDRSDYIDTDALDGTIINDAVYERNALIEELFNVEITMFEAGDSSAKMYNQNITNDVMGGKGAYDCTLGWDGSGLTTSGYFMNLLSFPELDFANDPWWFDSWHENSTFYDCMFTCNGDLQFEIYYDIEIVYFNKEMAQSLIVQEENNLPISSLVYQHVDAKTWTLDQLQKYGAIAAIDAGEDGFHTKYEKDHEKSQDVFGSLMNENVSHVAMFAMGAKYSNVNNGAVEFTFTKEQNYNAFNKLFAFYNDSAFNYMAEISTHGKQSYEIFNDRHALFCWNAFFMAPQIKASGVPYGILPLPMYEAGGEYITSAYHMSYFAFLTTTPNFHKAALVFNAMNALSTDILYDKYFGEYLELRVSDDPDSSRMIPLIYESLYFDCAYTNPLLSNNGFYYFGNYINTGTTSITGEMERFKDMDDYVEAMQTIYLDVKYGNSR